MTTVEFEPRIGVDVEVHGLSREQAGHLIYAYGGELKRWDRGALREPLYTWTAELAVAQLREIAVWLPADPPEEIREEVKTE